MFFTAALFVLCLLGTARLHKASILYDRRNVVSTSQTGVCLYGEAAERILSLALAMKDSNPKCHRRRPRDCNDIPELCPSDVYTVYPRYSTGFDVYCEMKIDGGHWTVFQRRENGAVDFFRGWDDYKHGFGDIEHEFWLGNKQMHSLTAQGRYEMRIDLSDFDGNHAFAKYKDFKIGDASSKFKLTATGYNGTAGNSLAHHNGNAFSTKDMDNDNSKLCYFLHWRLVV